MLLLFNSDQQKESALSDFKDPFSKDKIEAIHLHCYKSMFFPHDVTFSGSIKFKNGNTEGEHKINASDFPSLIKLVDCFIKEL